MEVELAAAEEVTKHHEVDGQAKVVDEKTGEARSFGHFVVGLEVQDGQRTRDREQVSEEALPRRVGKVEG